MKNIEFNRIVSVAKWDITINRHFYTRMGLLVIALMLVPVIINYTFELITRINLPSGIQFPDNIGGMKSYLSIIMTVVTCVALGYTFHNLLTRQSRIQELTLPSTHLERFLWHVFVTLIGTQILMFVGVVLADFIHLLFALGTQATDLQSLTQIMYKDYFYTSGNSINSIMAMLFLGAIGNSFFVLINAWRYKYNILWTIILGIGIITLSTIILVLLFNSSGVQDVLWQIKHNSPEWLFPTVYFLIGITILSAEWWGAYKLYTKAQVTTRRNP